MFQKQKISMAFKFIALKMVIYPKNPKKTLTLGIYRSNALGFALFLSNASRIAVISAGRPQYMY